MDFYFCQGPEYLCTLPRIIVYCGLGHLYALPESRASMLSAENHTVVFCCKGSENVCVLPRTRASIYSIKNHSVVSQRFCLCNVLSKVLHTPNIQPSNAYLYIPTKKNYEKIQVRRQKDKNIRNKASRELKIETGDGIQKKEIDFVQFCYSFFLLFGCTKVGRCYDIHI